MSRMPLKGPGGDARWADGFVSPAVRGLGSHLQVRPVGMDALTQMRSVCLGLPGYPLASSSQKSQDSILELAAEDKEITAVR